jgi:arsenite methyltransferase
VSGDGAHRARDRVVDGAALQPGDYVLELAPGDGLLTFALLERIGDGWVFAVDPSVAVLEELLRRAHAADVAGVMYLVGDATVIPLPDASADVCVARSFAAVDGGGLEAVGEIARVLRPGGRLSALAGVAGGPAGDAADGAALAAALAAAGFADVRIEPQELDGEPTASVTARRA